jgi:hypothetical protein
MHEDLQRSHINAKEEEQHGLLYYVSAPAYDCLVPPLPQMHEELKRSHINAKEEQHDKLVDQHKKAISRVEAVQVYHRQLRVLVQQRRPAIYRGSMLYRCRQTASLVHAGRCCTVHHRQLRDYFF